MSASYSAVVVSASLMVVSSSFLQELINSPKLKKPRANKIKLNLFMSVIINCLNVLTPIYRTKRWIPYFFAEILFQGWLTIVA
jgi:hypothetical protein